MRIGFDVSQTCVNKSGTGFYADQLARALARQDKVNRYFLLPRFYDYIQGRAEDATSIEQPNFQTVSVGNFSRTDELFGSLDIVHSNNFRYPKDVDARKIVTIHDVSFMDRPEFTTEENRMFCFRGTFDAVLNADMIIAVSEYTRERLLYYFPYVDKKRIRVVYEGSREALKNERDDAGILSAYGLEPQEYFLSVGTIEPRKNYDTLLKAYRKYKENNRADYKKLCIAGGHGWMEEDFGSRIKGYGLGEDVIVTGYVTDEVLSNLYRYSYAYVYTTWYEGFGLPLLEAMSFGKPIIASNVTSVPEVAGDAAILLNPENSNTFADAMELLQKDKKRYDELSAKAAQRAKMFSWDKTAGAIIDIYNEIEKVHV